MEMADRQRRRLKPTEDILEAIQPETLEEPSVALTAEQQSVVEMALRGSNIFLTGAGKMNKPLFIP